MKTLSKKGVHKLVGVEVRESGPETWTFIQTFLVAGVFDTHVVELTTWDESVAKQWADMARTFNRD